MLIRCRNISDYMDERKAIARIGLDPNRGWVLPTFGSKPLRYWAHVHFEKDPTWGQKTWTFLIDLDGPPDLTKDHFIATVHFLSPNAPHNLIESDAKFELVCGESRYTHGVIEKPIN